jgi:hypothetical protein
MGWLHVHGVMPLWPRTCYWAPPRLWHGAAEDTSALWVSAPIGHAWGMLSTQTVRSLPSLGAVCILRLPCPMATLSPLGHDGLPSSCVREAGAARCSTWTSGEIAPFCSLVFPPVPLTLPGIGRAVDTKSFPPALVLLACLGGVV